MTVTLGEVFDGERSRDAIHVAIAPVVAATKLYPGQDVGIIEVNKAGPSEDAIGIVDPFIKHPVQEGDGFYMFLYPNTIEDMRHHWMHPAFDKQTVSEASNPEEVAKQWIEGFATRLGYGVDRLMAMAEEYQLYGDHVRDDAERYKEHWDDFPEFWEHYETLRGCEVKDKDCFFTCSC